METSAKSGVFKYEHSWSIPQTLENLAIALAQGSDVSISTSGSTGAPKEILIPASAMIFSARNSNLFLGAKPGDRWSLLLSPEHTAGINVLVRSIELGTAPVSETESADFTAIVPTQLFRALNGDGQLLKHLQGCKAVLVGGAHADENLLVQAKNLGINCITTYGMTETSGGCVYNGAPLEGVQVAITDAGFIKVSGPVLASNLALDTNNWFVTSDLGELVDGELKVLGRGDDVIISGGENISLSEIENAISQIFANFEFAAFSVSSDKWGQELHVAAVNAPAEFAVQVATLLVEKFGNAAKPKRFHQLAALPLIGIGKVDRLALAQLAMKSES